MSINLEKSFAKIQLDAIKKEYIKNFTQNRNGNLPIAEVKKMLEDDTVQMALRSIGLALKSLDIGVECDNTRQQEFIQDNLDSFKTQYVDLFEIALALGYNCNEVIFEKDKYWDINSFRDLNLSNIEIVRDDNDYIEAFRDRANMVTIPVYKTFWATWKATYSNPKGESILKPAYRAWFYKNLLINSMTQYYERRGEPPFWIKYPPNPKIYDTDDESRREDDNQNKAVQIAENFHQDKFIVTPDVPEGQPQFRFQEIQMDNRGDSFLEPINVFDKQIMKSLLMPDTLMTGGEAGQGSFALSKSQTDLRSQFLDGIMESFFDVLTNETGILTHLSRINFGNAAKPIRLTSMRFSDNTKQLYYMLLDKLIASPKYNVPIDTQELLESLNLPIGNSIRPQQFSKVELESKKDALKRVTKANSAKATIRDKKLDDIYSKNKKGIYKKSYKPLEKWLVDNANKYYRRYKNNPENAELNIPKELEHTIQNQWNSIILVGFLSGIRDVNEHAIRVYNKKNFTKLELVKIEIDEWYDKTPEQVVEIFRSQIGLEYSNWKGLQEFTEVRAFSLALANSEKISNSFKRSLTKAIETGTSQRDWVKSVQKELIPALGLQPQADYYLNTVYRTNMASAYGAGNWAARESDFVNSVLPALQYCAVGDDRTRPSHIAMDGVVIPVNDPFWNEWYPPNGFNCRCYTIDVDIDDYEKIGDNPPSTNLSPDKGFSGNVGKQWIEEITSIPN